MRSLRRLAARYHRGGLALGLSASYAVVVVGVTTVVIISVSTSAPSFAAIWLFLVTAPISIPMLFVLPLLERFGTPVSPAWMLMFTVGGLFQAWVLWRFCRGSRAGA